MASVSRVEWERSELVLFFLCPLCTAGRALLLKLWPCFGKGCRMCTVQTGTRANNLGRRSCSFVTCVSACVLVFSPLLVNVDFLCVSYLVSDIFKTQLCPCEVMMLCWLVSLWKFSPTWRETCRCGFWLLFSFGGWMFDPEDELELCICFWRFPKLPFF